MCREINICTYSLYIDPVIVVHYSTVPAECCAPGVQFETVCACRIHHLFCFSSAILAEYSTCVYFCTYCSHRVQAVPGKVGVDGEVLLQAREYGAYF